MHTSHTSAAHLTLLRCTHCTPQYCIFFGGGEQHRGAHITHVRSTPYLDEYTHCTPQVHFSSWSAQGCTLNTPPQHTLPHGTYFARLFCSRDREHTGVALYVLVCASRPRTPYAPSSSHTSHTSHTQQQTSPTHLTQPYTPLAALHTHLEL